MVNDELLIINAIKVLINDGQHCSQVHKNTNVPMILKVWDFMFFSWEKHIISHFLVFFEGPFRKVS
jgi:hypothetical protein